jgi:uncharacterized protein
MSNPVRTATPPRTAERERVLGVLRAHADDLRRRGVRHAAVFGSVARGEDRPDSDLDIMVELAPEVGLFAFAELRLHLSDLLGREVDLVTGAGLRPFARPGAERDAVRAF